MAERSIYLDNNATTAMAPEVQEIMTRSFELYGNASSMHGPGRAAARAVEEARERVAALIGASDSEIIFTSGGSESNNTVLQIARERYLRGERRCRIVTSTIEHPSIIEAVKAYEAMGVPVTLIGVDSAGKLLMEDYLKALGDDVAIVSVMIANNEIGTIQDIREIARAAKACGALMHTDAVQAAGKIALDVADLGVDLLSLSAHKFYGPKGVGVLFIRKGVKVGPLIHGGHQEHGLRAGTYNNQSIIGLGRAAELALSGIGESGYVQRIAGLRDRLREGILESIPNVHVNGHPTDILPGTLNVSFSGAEGESILLYLDMEGIAVSTGSACATGSLEPSYVLMETGVGAELAHGSIRFSLGAYSTQEDIEHVMSVLPPIIARLREMSTL